MLPSVEQRHEQPVRPWRTFVPLLPWAVIGVVLFAAALAVDARVADAVHDHGVAVALRRHPMLLAAWKSPGDFWFTAVVAIGGWLSRRLKGRSAVSVLMAGALSGLNVIPKWIVGRTRPFKLGGEVAAQPFALHPFRHGFDGFFHQQNLSFPSGHACTAFALALSIWVVSPRASALFLLLATAVGVERVLENAHYCSDVVAALPVAVISVGLAWPILLRAGSGLKTESAAPALNK